MPAKTSQFPWLFVLLAAVAAVVPFLWLNTGKDVIAWRTDLSAAMSEAKAAGKPVMVYFTADWCPPCKVMKRGVFSQASAKEAIEARVVPVKVDLTNRSGPGSAVAGRFNVRSIPTLMVLDDAGAAKSSRSGGVGESELIEWLDQAMR